MGALRGLAAQAPRVSIEAPAANGAPAFDAERLPVATIWAYCLPMIGTGFMGMLFGIWLM